MLKTKILPMQDNCSWAQLHRVNRALIFSARPSQFGPLPGGSLAAVPSHSDGRGGFAVRMALSAVQCGIKGAAAWAVRGGHTHAGKGGPRTVCGGLAQGNGTLGLLS